MQTSSLVMLMFAAVVVLIGGMILTHFVFKKKEGFNNSINGAWSAGLTNGQSIVKGEEISDKSKKKLEIQYNGDLVYRSTHKNLEGRHVFSRIIMQDVEKVEVTEEGPEVLITKSDGTKVRWVDKREEGPGVYALYLNNRGLDFVKFK